MRGGVTVKVSGYVRHTNLLVAIALAGPQSARRNGNFVPAVDLRALQLSGRRLGHGQKRKWRGGTFAREDVLFDLLDMVGVVIPIAAVQLRMEQLSFRIGEIGLNV